MKRAERIEDLDLPVFRAQGIVSADVLIPIFIAWYPVEESPGTAAVGWPAVPASSYP